jgi:glucokinase
MVADRRESRGVSAAISGRPILVGVDVGGTTIAAGAVTADGEVGHDESMLTHDAAAIGTLVAIERLLQRLSGALATRGLTVESIGVGVPGPVDVETGRVGEPAPHVADLVGQPIVERLAARFGVPVFVDNDVNALVLAEWTWGAGRGARSLVMLALGTGVGGGIVPDGRLQRGAAGSAGELGHVPIAFDGPPCICGGRGCLKAFISGTDIARRGEDRLGRPVGAAEVFQLAATGQAEAVAIVDEVCRALGAGLAVIVNGLNPERVLLAGSVAKSLRPLEARIRASLADYAFAVAIAATRLEILSLDKDATVRGGAALVRYETDRRRTRA